MQPWPTVRFVNLLDDLQYAVWISFVQECGQIGESYDYVTLAWYVFPRCVIPLFECLL